MNTEVVSISLNRAQRDSEVLIGLRDVNNYDVVSNTQTGREESAFLRIVELCDTGKTVFVTRRLALKFKHHVRKLLNLSDYASIPYDVANEPVDGATVLVEGD